MAHRIFRKNLLTIGIPAAALCVVAVVVFGDDKNAAQAGIDSRASETLQKLSSYLDGLDAYSTRISQTLTMRGAFGDDDSQDEFTFAVQKPNKFAMTTTAGAEGEAIISDGDNLYTHVPAYSSYAETDAPQTLSEVFHRVQNEHLMLGELPAALISPLFAPGGIAENATIQSATYEGVEQVGGNDAHRVNLVAAPNLTESARERLRGEMGADAELVYYLDLWIDSSDEARLHKVQFDLAKMLQKMAPDMMQMMPEMAEMTYHMSMTFEDWTTGEDVSGRHFAFSAPEGVEKVGSIDELLAMAGASSGASNPNEMLGKPAPEFEMPLLGDGTVTSEQHKGQEIVILDFWATWCGPCIQAMPSLMEIAENYKDRGVVLYAVNVRENPESVEKFIEDRGWDLNVPFDGDGSVAGRYNVSGLPQTVIIGKDGTVQAVHLGFSPRMKQQLTSEIDTLLAGENLVTAGE